MNIRIWAALVGLNAGFCLGSAHAGPCGDEAVEWQRRLEAHPELVGTAPQTVDAQLMHQPTPASIDSAKKAARVAVAEVLAKAKAADDAGKPEQCREALAKAKLRLKP
jgi:hypothetical protein